MNVTPLTPAQTTPVTPVQSVAATPPVQAVTALATPAAAAAEQPPAEGDTKDDRADTRRESASAAAAASARLIIEQDETSGAFVYKLLDPETGKVVRQFPREQLLKLRTSEDYSPGDVFSGLF